MLYSAAQYIHLTTDFTDYHGYRNDSEGKKPAQIPSPAEGIIVNLYLIEYP